MIHNEVEDRRLQAYAEGIGLVHACAYELERSQVARLWKYGSVLWSWLMELARRAFVEGPELAQLRGDVQVSGEGCWSVLEAVKRGAPDGVIAVSLFSRFESRYEDAFAMRVIAALHKEFGGHAVKQS